MRRRTRAVRALLVVPLLAIGVELAGRAGQPVAATPSRAPRAAPAVAPRLAPLQARPTAAKPTPARPTGAARARAAGRAPVADTAAVLAAEHGPVVPVEARLAPAADSSTGGATLTTVRLRNGGDRPRRYRPTALLPRGWRLVTGATPLYVPARGEALWIGGVVAPRGAPADAYALGVDFVPEDDATADAAPRFAARWTAHVAPRPRVALSTEAVPPAATAGERVHVDVRVANTGNVDAAVRVGVRWRLLPRDAGGEELPAGRDTVLALARGASQVLRLSTATPARLARDLPLVAEIGASVEPPAPGARDSARAVATARTLLVPAAERATRVATLPLFVTLRAAPRGAALPYELNGEGRLGDGVALSLVSRGGGPPTTLFGERHEHRLAMRARHASLLLGDQPFAATSLVEPGVNVAGLSLAGTRAGTQLGGALLRAATADRVGAARGDRLAGLLVAHQRDSLDLAASLVARRGVDAGTVGGARARLAVGGHARVELEGAGGRGDTAGGVASRVRVEGRRRGALLRAQWADGARDFPGRARGARDARIELEAPVRRGVAAFAAASRGATAGALVRVPADLGLGDAVADGLVMLRLPTERQGALAIGARLGGLATVELATQSRAGAIGTLRYDGVARLARARVTQRVGATTLSASAEVGGVSDRRGANDGATRRLAATVARPVVGRGVLAAQADLARGPTLWGGPQASGSFGASLALPVTPRLDVRVAASASAHRALLDGLVPLDRRLTWRHVDAGAEWRPGGGHVLGVRVRAAHAGRAPVPTPVGRSAVLSYGRPVGLPVWRAPSREVAVRLVDDATSRPLAGAVARLDGTAARADGDGVARFRADPSRPHRLALEPAEEGDADALAGRTAAARDGLAVAPQRRGAMQEVRLAASASVEGVVRLAARDTALAWMPVTLVHADGDSVAARADAAGRVRVAGLRPGAWRVRAASPAPDGHRFAADGVPILLAAGGAQRFELIATPAPRAVRALPVVAAAAAPR